MWIPDNSIFSDQEQSLNLFLDLDESTDGRDLLEQFCSPSLFILE